MQYRTLGKSGIKVSAVGLGTIRLGHPKTSDTTAARVIDTALVCGITLIDTARSYGVAEERIGNLLGSRRNQVVLSTKLGYGVPGLPDWTPECITAGVDAALRRLHTDRIDIAHLHSCPAVVFERKGLIDALERARDRGKVRAIGYSGDNENLDKAIATGRFDIIQTSVNLVDRRSLDAAVPRGQRAGQGVLAKRPLANVPWRADMQGSAQPGSYADRWRQLRAELDTDADWADVALRFAAFSPGVDACLVGTGNQEHLEQASASLERGPLSAAMLQKLHAAYVRVDGSWPGVV